MLAEKRQRECSQRHSEVRAGRLSGRFRLRAYRTVQTRPVSRRSVHHGIFPDVYFYTHSLQRPHKQRPMASRREQVSALFFVAWTQRRLTVGMFPWATKGPNPPKETLTFKNELFWQTTSGSLPAGLNGIQKGQVHSKKQKPSKKHFCWRSTSGSPPTGLKVSSDTIMVGSHLKFKLVKMKLVRASRSSVVHIKAVQSPVWPAKIFQRFIDTVVCKRCLSQSFRHQSTSCAKNHIKAVLCFDISIVSSQTTLWDVAT